MKKDTQHQLKQKIAARLNKLYAGKNMGLITLEELKAEYKIKHSNRYWVHIEANEIYDLKEVNVKIVGNIMREHTIKNTNYHQFVAHSSSLAHLTRHELEVILHGLDEIHSKLKLAEKFARKFSKERREALEVYGRLTSKKIDEEAPLYKIEKINRLLAEITID